MYDYLVGISYGDFDDRIKVSSQWNEKHSIKGCHLNRLMQNENASAWCAGGDDMKNPWIQVDLGDEFLINAVSIQGRGEDFYKCNQYVKRFRILWSNTDERRLRHLDEFEGNSDNKTVVKRYFKEPIRARIIRLCVLEYNEHPSLRWELHYIMDKTCDKNNNSNNAPLPSTPQ